MDAPAISKILNVNYDLTVIGAGSAGFSAAISAAEQGARVALIGNGTIGGTCVNIGCVPSKALIRAAEALHLARAAERFDGIKVAGEVTNWGAVMAQKQALVESLRQAKYADVLPTYDAITYIKGQAGFAPDGSLRLGDQIIRAKKIIIATGARPGVPPIDGINEVDFLTSTSALEIAALPKSLIIVGAGFIGVELAQMFARFGVTVTLISRRGLLPNAEPEISKALTGYLRGEGVNIETCLTYERIFRQESSHHLQVTTTAGPKTFTAEKVLIATGRTPNVAELNLAEAGIKTNADGTIAVDEYMRTSREGVYAAGDVTGRDQFVYMAAYGAKIAAKNAMTCDELTYDNSAMPAVVFCDPQVASVGLSEKQAREAGFEVKTSLLTLDNVPRALAARDTRGLIKLVADAKSKKLLGAHILAPEGSDSIQTAVMAIKAGMTYEELGATIFPYLTTVEGLKLAAQTFEMDVKKLSCCAG